MAWPSLRFTACTLCAVFGSGCGDPGDGPCQRGAADIAIYVRGEPVNAALGDFSAAATGVGTTGNALVLEAKFEDGGIAFYGAGSEDPDETYRVAVTYDGTLISQTTVHMTSECLYTEDIDLTADASGE